MPKISAGLLLFRRIGQEVEVLLVHPGGPFWANKDRAAWSVPKGLVGAGEETLAAAKREFTEETGLSAPPGEPFDLGFVTYGNKKVIAWAIEADADVSAITSDLISMEWPPRSGKTLTFPECDRAGWFDAQTAKAKLVPGQVPFIDRMVQHVV
jgi:predicted NUDIX family NTP pyrophosphohydrolase